MEIIAENEKYEIKVNTSKNRIYFKVIGFWESIEDVPNYLSDIEKAIKKVTSGFSVIADLSKAKTPKEEVGQLHAKALDIMMKNNLNKIAEIVDSAILKMSTKRHSESAKLKKQTFQSLEEAEKWLDE